MNKPTLLIVHHTGGTDLNPLEDTSHHTFEVVDAYHKKLWNFKSALGHYIGYHYFIDKNGKVTQGRNDNEEGAHTIGKNLSSLGICLAGNFDVTRPTMLQAEALQQLLLSKMATYGLGEEQVVPHRAFAKKTCYGRNLSDSWARELVRKPEQEVKAEIRAHLKAVDGLLDQL